MTGGDTIAAIATAPGRGAIGIVRVSGDLVREIVRFIAGHCPPPRAAQLATFRDAAGTPFDSGLLLFFPSPHSFTGEDTVEFQGHGGPAVLDLLLTTILHQGARLAWPGEFSARAFQNGKLDLTQAEAIADLIEAGSAQTARLAHRGLQGTFSRRIQALAEPLLELRAFVEASIDFVEEDLDPALFADLERRLTDLHAACVELHRAAQQGRILRQGFQVVLAGPPNAGKSTLLNALAGEDIAIVTQHPGTTRDLLRASIHINGLPIHLVDTAGLRETGDAIEKEGVRRAWDAAGSASRILWITDATVVPDPGVPDEIHQLGVPITRVFNQIDRLDEPPARGEEDRLPWLKLSAATGAGLDLLRQHLKQAAGLIGEEGNCEFLARRRHLDALEQALTALTAAQMAWKDRGLELIAEDLREAQNALGQITGAVTPDDVLTVIFGSFCIGK
ncbi:MAG: tRNA uridine-5-carboxymethylaminomethyl(34) synthesis GTPase MnmE [Pseudomonadota bacterium]